MRANIRKIVHYQETVLVEGYKPASQPWQQGAVAAVITNPWAGQYVDNLDAEIKAFGPELGELLTAEILQLMGGAENIQAYGKAALVGTQGEIEHASALIHTLLFGNFYREALEAKSYLSFTNTRGGPDAPISIPMMHLHDLGKRSHYLTVQFSINDAPAADELVIALGAANGGRPHHRIGDRYKDLEMLGHDPDNPASV